MRVTAFFSLVLAAVSVAGSARPARAQSLGDVSRQEEERRKDVKTPAKVYTNKDLGAPPQTSPAAATPAPGAPGASGTPPAQAPAAADDKNKDTTVKDQKYWSGRKKALDAKLERDKVLADAMQSRINQLTADFSARSDPAQRSVLERDRQRAVSEFDGLQKTIKDDQKALTDLDEEARKASVPPGWLR
jgi:hypothetical protein